MLVRHKATDVKYTKDIGGSGELPRFEHTDRTIIPTYIPAPNIKAIDVTDMSEEQIALLESRLAEYAEYYETAVKTIFSFNTWLEHTHQELADDLKWRTFKQSNLTER